MSSSSTNPIVLFHFQGVDGIPPSSIELSRKNLCKSAFAASMLSTMTSSRWIASGDVNEYSVDTSNLPGGWSPACAAVLKDIYENTGADDAEDKAITLPATVELEEFAIVADYFGLRMDLDTLVVGGGVAAKLRAKSFLSNRKNVQVAVEFVKSELLAKESMSAKFIIISPGDSLCYINKSTDEPLLKLADDNYRNYNESARLVARHYEWGKSEACRNRFVDLLDDDDLDATWAKSYVELAGARDSNSNSYDEVSTIHAHRWTVKVQVREAEPLPKRAKVENSSSSAASSSLSN